MPDPADEPDPPAAEATPEAVARTRDAAPLEPGAVAADEPEPPVAPDAAPVREAGPVCEAGPVVGAAPVREAGPVVDVAPLVDVAGIVEFVDDIPDVEAVWDGPEQREPTAAGSPADLVRPYVARHHQDSGGRDDPMTDETLLDDLLAGPLDETLDDEVATGRHGLDPSAFADTAEFPLLLLDGDDDDPAEAAAGQGRRTLLAVGVAVLAILATLIGVALAAPRTPPAALEPTAPATTVVEPTSVSAGPVLTSPTTAAPSASPVATRHPGPASTASRVAPPPTAQPTPTVGPTSTPTLVGPTGPITSMLSANRCVDLQGNDASPGVAVQSFGCNGTAAQVWTVAPDGSFQVRGLCLQPAGQSTAAGTMMVVGRCDGSAAQQFQISGTGRIRQGTTLCLSIPGDSLGDVQLIMDNCRRNDNGQRWATP